MNHQEKKSILSTNNDTIDNITNNMSNLKIKQKDIRPTFYFDDDKSKPIRAGGILFYKIINNKKHFLFIDNKHSNWIEDLGGKTDIVDKSIMNTIIREVDEETNKLIKRRKIYECMFKESKKFYCEYSKYLLYCIKADEYISNLSSEDFGEIEFHTGFKRQIIWLSQDEIKKNKLNPRLHISSLNEFFISV